MELWGDLQYALRSLRNSPGFTIAALAALALGIASNTAIFTVINTVILRPLPFAGADRIVSIGRPGGNTASIPMFEYWEAHNPGFEDLSASLAGSRVNLEGGDRPQLVATARVSLRYFRLFGAKPALGRTFTAAEDRPGGPQAIVLSYGLWQQGFSLDPSVLGRAIRLGGADYTVVGVLGPGFVAYPPAEAWVPLQADPNSADAAHVLRVCARLPRPTSVAQAAAQMAAIGKRYMQTLAPRLIVGNDDKVEVAPLQEQMTGSIRPSLLILFGAVELVLLMACANVANLLMARATGRQKEMAVRAAMGAGRGRILRQLLTESLALAIAGGAIGLGLGSWGLHVLLRLTPGDLPRAQELASAAALDARVAAFAVGLAVLTGTLFGLVPALQASRIDLVSAFKESSGRTGSGLRHRRTRGLLVVTEVAMAVVLLCGAVLLIRSFAAMHAVRLGFDPQQVLTIEVSLAGPGYAKAGTVERIGRQAVERVEAIPGVESAAMASALPLFGSQDMLFAIPGRPVLEGGYERADVQWRIVSPEYFRVLRIPLRSGRLLREREAGRTVVISEAMARKYWPKTDPVGQSIGIGSGLGPEYDSGISEIVGVVGDVRERLNLEPAAVMYQTPAQVLDGAMALVNRLDPAAILVRTRKGVAPMSVAQEVQDALWRTAQLPVGKIRVMEQVSRDSTARLNFNLLLLGVFAAMALVLASVGIYGVMSYSVEQRTHEIGIRTALGASRSDTLKLVLRQAMRMTAVGVAAGAGCAFGLMRLLSAELYGVKSSDPATFAAAAAILTAVGIAAAAVPAARATRLDALSALRHE